MEKNQKIALVIVILLGLGSLIYLGVINGILKQTLTGEFEWKGLTWSWTKGGDAGYGSIDIDGNIRLSSYATTTTSGPYHRYSGSAGVMNNINICDYKKVKIDGAGSVYVDNTACYDHSASSSVCVAGYSIGVSGCVKSSKSTNNPEYTLQDDKIFVKDLQGNSALIDCPVSFSFSVSSSPSDKAVSNAQFTLNDIYFDTDGDDVWDRDDECPEEYGTDVNGCNPKPYCGDNKCNGNETCETCPEDCGACPCTEGWIGIPFCQNNNIIQTWQNTNCNTETKTKEDCTVTGKICENGICVEKKGFPIYYFVIGVIILMGLVGGGIFVWKKIKR